MASKRVAKSLINTALSFRTLAADGTNASGGVVSVALAGAKVGDRVISIFGHVKANTGAHTFLTPAIGTVFESVISVADHVQQLTTDLSLNTYVFLIMPAKMTMQRP